MVFSSLSAQFSFQLGGHCAGLGPRCKPNYESRGVDRRPPGAGRDGKRGYAVRHLARL